MSGTIEISAQNLYQLIKEKLTKAGLKSEYAQTVAEHLVFADASGVHSHGAVRVDYYAERIAKGGVNLEPNITFEKTGPSSGVVNGDNGMGHVVALEALNYGFDLAKESGIAVVGVKKMSHSGMMGYYARKAAENNLIALSICQSDPMVVPFGGTENYFGTNPIAFAAPRKENGPVVFDMATTVQAWGKILDARAKDQEIPTTWAVDKNGKPTSDPHAVRGLLLIAGPKGYGLMMMVDILAGMLLNLPFGKHVSSMYSDLTKGRNLGQFYLLIDPQKFTDINTFTDNIETMVQELHDIPPAKGFDQVYYPGEINQLNLIKSEQEGISIAENVYDYLKSDTLHFDQYGGMDAFAER